MKILNFTPSEIQSARESVADDWADIARAIRADDSYAAHVTEETKNERLATGLSDAEKIRRGELDHNFTIAQRIHTKLTGVCVPLLPPPSHR